MYSIDMSAPSTAELHRVLQAAELEAAWTSDDYVVHWHSSFGVIIIEVRAGQVFVNGEVVLPAGETVCVNLNQPVAKHERTSDGD